MKVKNIILSILLGTAFASCSDMNDLHIGYLKKGEQNYAAKIDSVSPGCGNRRVNMELFINSQRIDKLRFYWNSYKDSVDFLINNQTGRLNFMINDLQEREYLFQIVSFDKYGNRSLPVEAVATVYGESYRKTLPNRHIESLKLTAKGEAAFKWAIPADQAEKTILTYTDKAGVLKKWTVPVTTTTDTIPDVKPGSIFEYYTIYRPASNSPDTFNTDTLTKTIPNN